MSGPANIIPITKVTNRPVGSAVPIDVSIVDGSGNQITSFGGSGGTADADESAHTAGVTLGTPMQGVYESSPSTLSSGQVGTVGITTDRKLKVSGSFTAGAITASTPTLTNVSASATSVQLLAANASRLGATIFNDSTSVLYVKFGATASATSYTVQLQAYAYYELPTTAIYTGEIDGIWVTATGAARVTELTA